MLVIGLSHYLAMPLWGIWDISVHSSQYYKYCKTALKSKVVLNKNKQKGKEKNVREKKERKGKQKRKEKRKENN